MGARPKKVARRARSAVSKSVAPPRPVAPGDAGGLAAKIAELAGLDQAQLRLRWRDHLGGTFPAHLPKWPPARVLAYRMQAAASGGLDAEIWRKIRGSSAEADGDSAARFKPRSPASKEGVILRPGALILSLAFLAPDLVKSAIEGRLPRGFNRSRLVDLPMLWSKQWRALGLQPSEINA